MLYTTAAVVALLPTFGVATRFLSGSGNVQPISQEDLQAAGGDLGTPNLATSMLAGTWSTGNGLTSSNGNSLPASNQDFPEGDSPQGNGNAGKAEGVNTCGFSTSVQLKEDYGYSQASVQDCYYLLWSIEQDQEWIITQEIRTLVENGTCAFQAVVSQGQGTGLVGAVGNGDIHDIVTDSIDQFGDDGYVGCHGGFGMYTSAAGAMPCDSPNLSSGEQVFVDWFLTTPDGLNGGGGSNGGSNGGGSNAGSYGGGNGGSNGGGSNAGSYGGGNGGSNGGGNGGSNAGSYGGGNGGSNAGSYGGGNGGSNAGSYGGGNGGSNAGSYGGGSNGGGNGGGSNAGSYGGGRFAVRAVKL